jgi:hypothetical protein
VARIRSIKPDFFTSETMASLPFSARLTFIGLWTYVDDNGVGLDNERLIIAAVWPLEADVIGTLQMLREDLMRLSGAHLVTRYAADGRKLIHIRSWTEHQKVQHPRKPRYPQPATAVTSVNGASGAFHEPLMKDSGAAHETFTPEQGAGSREQGAGSTTAEVVTTSVEGGTLGAAGLPEGKWLNKNGEAKELPAASLNFEAERRRQMDALMAEYPEAAQ